MTDSEFTREEMNAIRRLRRAFDNMPESLVLNLLDDWLYVNKVGVPCDDLKEVVGRHIAGGLVLCELHDERDFGRDR